MKRFIAPFILILLYVLPVEGQVTGLSGWNIYLDPGHSRKENMGVYGYSEAERNLRVALRLMEYLRETTDIDTVFICRTNDQQTVNLSQRTDHANSVGAAWFHSIHSDASGSPTANSTLLLYGQIYDGSEKVPNGGKALSEIMVDLLTRGMRTTTRGARGDCSFYSPWTTPCTAAWPGPWLHVNRNTSMPSELSESGFHTNPVQNQRFMNAEWKRLEAMTFYWSILKLFDIDRPSVGICTGIVSDVDTEVPVNGAEIVIEGKTYTTDTYESLFYKYTNDPDKLHNGFYFIDSLSAGTHQMIVSADGYYADTLDVTMVDTFFTFQDVELISMLSPYVLSTTPVPGDTNTPAWDDIVIQFSRTMDPASVEAAFDMEPEVEGEFLWEDLDRRLRFQSDSLDFETEYTLTIGGDASDIFGHPFDGNGDGIGGDAFVLNFKTGPSDLTAPRLIALEPGRNAIAALLPIVSAVFDESLDPVSVSQQTMELKRSSDQSPVTGTIVHYPLEQQSVLSYFPDDVLLPDEKYSISIHPGYTDLFGNAASGIKFSWFNTTSDTWNVTLIDDFESRLTDFWWDPQQSGSTVGIVTQQTGRFENTEIINLNSGSTVSMQIDYGWDETASDWLIRTYLNSGPPRSVTFDSEYVMQAWVFGDGSGNQFRFCVDDHYPASSGVYHEVSPWVTVDWLGWKLVSWDMTNDGTGSWIGNDIMEGTLRFDSIQLTHVPGATLSGRFVFDDLRIIRVIPSDVEDILRIPASFVLEQNYPNPFNPETTIRYHLQGGSRRSVLEIYDLLGRKVRTLVDEVQSPGIYVVLWDGRDDSGWFVASGQYVYTLRAGEFRDSKRLVLIR